MKRGLTYAEAISYVGVKRRTFDQLWRPRLVALHQGTCLIFDREDLDILFERFKRDSDSRSEPASSQETPSETAQNTRRNGRSIVKKGVGRRAEQLRGSTPEKTEPGKSTSGRMAPDFDSVASSILRKPSAG